MNTSMNAYEALDSLGAEMPAHAALQALIWHVETAADCPCCQEKIACLDSCTFAMDCPEEIDRMVAARTALGFKP